MAIAWSQRYAARTRRIQSSVIRELLKFTTRPDVISFAGGLPAAELFPVQAFQRAASRVLQQSGPSALQYSITEGYLPLREWLCARYAQKGVSLSPDNILITTGSAQALYLCGKVFVNPGDAVLVESPTFLGALQAWNSFQARYLDVPIDDQGLQTAQVESALLGAPRFAYVLPTYQNPAGTTMPLARRQRLLEITARFQVPILEDDPYGELYYDQPPPPSLLSLDLQRLPHADIEQGSVIHTSTFSKILAPGLRLAWVIAPSEVIRHFVRAKQGIDLHTSSFVQQVVYEVIKDGFLREHLPRLRRAYRQRRDAMLAALTACMPPQVSWTQPQGGMFLWLRLPPTIDATDLLERAQQRNVAFVPGSAFYSRPTPEATHTLRLNFSNVDEAAIHTGIARLAEAINSYAPATLPA